MALTLADVVTLDTPPTNGRHVRHPHPRYFDRRAFLRMAGGAGMAVGLSVLGWLPPMRTAWAGHRRYSLHDTCAGIEYGGCRGCCTTCGSEVSTAHCASNGWHRHDIITDIGTAYIDYSIRFHSCSNKNAWEWKVARCCRRRKNRRYRCSDGRYRWCISPSDCGRWHNTVCPKQIDTGTRC